MPKWGEAYEIPSDVTAHDAMGAFVVLETKGGEYHLLHWNHGLCAVFGTLGNALAFAAAHTLCEHMILDVERGILDKAAVNCAFDRADETIRMYFFQSDTAETAKE